MTPQMAYKHYCRVASSVRARVPYHTTLLFTKFDDVAVHGRSAVRGDEACIFLSPEHMGLRPKEPFCDRKTSRFVPAMDSDARVSNHHFLHGLELLHHEGRHLEQRAMMEGRPEVAVAAGGPNRDYCVDLAVADVGCIGNRDYYNANHHAMLFELDANKACVIRTHAYLQQAFKPGAAEDYVRHANFNKLRSYGIGMGRELSTMEDVMQAFDESIGISRSERIDAPNTRRPRPPGPLDDISIALDLGCRQGDIEPAARRMYEDASRHSVHFSLEMMACVSCYIRPDLRDRYPMLRERDLRPEHVFGASFKEPPEEMRSRIEQYRSARKQAGRARPAGYEGRCSDMPLAAQRVDHSQSMSYR